MLLDARGDSRPVLHRLPLAARVIATGLVLGGVASFLMRGRLPEGRAATTAVGAALKPYAHQLFTTYLLPVQVLGFLLLIAMIGVIALSRRPDGPEDAA
jgi:NADH-quinone oxidoreductase subunit J